MLSEVAVFLLNRQIPISKLIYYVKFSTHVLNSLNEMSFFAQSKDLISLISIVSSKHMISPQIFFLFHI